jgi:hypothetical protein
MSVHLHQPEPFSLESTAKPSIPGPTASSGHPGAPSLIPTQKILLCFPMPTHEFVVLESFDLSVGIFKVFKKLKSTPYRHQK